MNQWIGSFFYRGLDPSTKGYAELRYFHGWHKVIEAEWTAAMGSKPNA